MAILVKPRHRKTGNYAPSMISFHEREEEAIADVMQCSKLSASEDWSFQETKKLRDKVVKKKYSYEDD